MIYTLRIRDTVVAHELAVHGLFQMGQMSSPRCDDDIDNYDRAHGMNLEGFGYMSNEISYILGNRRVNVVLKKDQLNVRVSGIIKTLESYICNSCGLDIEAFLKKRRQKTPVVIHKRSSTSSDLERIGASFISKTFDAGSKKPLNVKNLSLEQLRPGKNRAFSPLGRVLNSSRNV